MNRLIIFCCFTLASIFTCHAQSKDESKPSVQDLDFLIGTWDVSLKWYDTYNPGSEPAFTETGTMTCTYDLNYRGTNKIISCRSELYTDSGRLKGRDREVLELIRWSRFSNAYERTGIYSNWPATGIEKFQFDREARIFNIEGELGVQDGMLERYSETYQFNEDYNTFSRRNIANFSDMPITEYNLTMTGTGVKKAE